MKSYSRFNRPPDSRIFIGNLDTNNVGRDEIFKVFSKHGKIMEEIRMHRGYAFVQYSCSQHAKDAIKRETGTQLGRKKVEVQFANSTSSDNSKLGKRKRNEEYDSRKRSKYNNSSSSSSHPYKKTVLKIPIFVLSKSLKLYGEKIKSRLRSLNIASDLFYVGGTFLNRVPNEKYLLYVHPRNSSNDSVSFCVIKNDGSSEGFVDTPIADCAAFIKNDYKTFKNIVPTQPVFVPRHIPGPVRATIPYQMPVVQNRVVQNYQLPQSRMNIPQQNYVYSQNNIPVQPLRVVSVNPSQQRMNYKPVGLNQSRNVYSRKKSTSSSLSSLLTNLKP